MPSYKLIYFNLRGRAEVARLIMHYANVEFEDFRVERADWPSTKANMPFGQMPVLEVDGKMLAQSGAICRYLANQHGLAGKDDFQKALVDQYAANIDDLLAGARPAFFEQDPEKKAELYRSFAQDKLIPHLKVIESHLAANGAGYLVGDKLTWADLSYYSFLTFALENVATILDDAPLTKALVDRVGDIPSIKSWVERRPVTAL